MKDKNKEREKLSQKLLNTAENLDILVNNALDNLISGCVNSHLEESRKFIEEKIQQNLDSKEVTIACLDEILDSYNGSNLEDKIGLKNPLRWDKDKEALLLQLQDGQVAIYDYNKTYENDLKKDPSTKKNISSKAWSKAIPKLYSKYDDFIITELTKLAEISFKATAILKKIEEKKEIFPDNLFEKLKTKLQELQKQQLKKPAEIESIESKFYKFVLDEKEKKDREFSDKASSEKSLADKASDYFSSLDKDGQKKLTNLIIVGLKSAANNADELAKIEEGNGQKKEKLAAEKLALELRKIEKSFENQAECQQHFVALIEKLNILSLFFLGEEINDVGDFAKDIGDKIISLINVENIGLFSENNNAEGSKIIDRQARVDLLEAAKYLFLSDKNPKNEIKVIDYSKSSNLSLDPKLDQFPKINSVEGGIESEIPLESCIALQNGDSKRAIIYVQDGEARLIIQEKRAGASIWQTNYCDLGSQDAWVDKVQNASRNNDNKDKIIHNGSCALGAFFALSKQWKLDDTKKLIESEFSDYLKDGGAESEIAKAAVKKISDGAAKQEKNNDHLAKNTFEQFKNQYKEATKEEMKDWSLKPNSIKVQFSGNEDEFSMRELSGYLDSFGKSLQQEKKAEEDRKNIELKKKKEEEAKKESDKQTEEKFKSFKDQLEKSINSYNYIKTDNFQEKGKDREKIVYSLQSISLAPQIANINKLKGSECYSDLSKKGVEIKVSPITSSCGTNFFDEYEIQISLSKGKSVHYNLTSENLDKLSEELNKCFNPSSSLSSSSANSISHKDGKKI